MLPKPMHLMKFRTHKNSPSSLWKTINRSISGNEKELQVYTKDQKVIADEFNQYFTSLGRNTSEEARRISCRQ